MTTKKKIARLSFPAAVVAFGGYLIVVKRAAYGVLAPEAEGPIVVFAGILLCLLGVWGFVGTFREFGKQGDESSPNQSGDFE